MSFISSALRDRISEADILHAVEQVAYVSEPDDDSPAKRFLLGSTPAGDCSNWRS
ncbi:hypothetical protein BJY21_003255 [Kineosphaera limosa]|uniref:hypothetical protein n=1 Tax=Kineosphaera limosa TaxID=111564 RepID=UPI00031A0EAF|nr:hypothetical protein [Kineosphaera limosa]NYE02071.1 hypothetical protein [Kineosphaera limosa]